MTGSRNLIHSYLLVVKACSRLFEAMTGAESLVLSGLREVNICSTIALGAISIIISECSALHDLLRQLKLKPLR